MTVSPSRVGRFGVTGSSSGLPPSNSVRASSLWSLIVIAAAHPNILARAVAKRDLTPPSPSSHPPATPSRTSPSSHPRPLSPSITPTTTRTQGLQSLGPFFGSIIPPTPTTRDPVSCPHGRESLRSDAQPQRPPGKPDHAHHRHRCRPTHRRQILHQVRLSTRRPRPRRPVPRVRHLHRAPSASPHSPTPTPPTS